MAKELKDLAASHAGFQMPQYSISVGGSEIKPDEYPIIDLNIFMSAEYDMGSCEIVIAAIFDHEKRQIKNNNVFDKFKPGKVVDVKVGYKKPLVGVFMGYINSISFDFDGQRGPYITISCLDAKGALVNNKDWENYDQMSIKEIFEKIIKDKCSSYIDKSKLKVEFDFDKGDKDSKTDGPEIKENMDDYSYIVMFAKKTNSSFCVIYDKMYFGKQLAQSGSAKVKLVWGESLLSFNAETDLSNQIGAVEVFGDNPVTQEPFTVKVDTISGAGESGADLASVAKNKTVVVIDPDVTTESQAKDLATRTLEVHSGQLMKCKGSTIGLPDIIAGDKIEISGMGKGCDGTYFLNHVTHRINGQGYITSFDGSSAKVSTK